MRRALPLVLLLLSTAALAQELPPLNGAGRITVEGGWRLTTNQTFYDSYYALERSQGLARAPGSPGGPFLAGSFGYGITENLELGIDLFATGEQLRLTGAPTLTNTSYGALVGVRFQTALNALAANGVVPFIGLATGPTLCLSQAAGGKQREVNNQTFVGMVGATFRLSARWGLTAEYRLAFSRGQSPLTIDDSSYANLSSFNSGGNWFTLGLTYLIAPTPDEHPLPIP
jgi:hypothetical protein